jgi:hypothetical protein
MVLSKTNSIRRKETTMFTDKEEHKPTEKQASGVWALLIFVALLASIITLAMTTM